MPNQDLINYIKQSREQKISDEQIRTALLGAGWKAEDINEGLGVSVSIGGKLASAFQIFKESWRIYKKRFLVFILLTIIPLILTTVLIAVISGVGLLGLALIFTGLAVWKIILFILIAILLFLLFTAIYTWGQTSLIYIVNENESGLKFIEAIKKGWHKIFSYWIISALIGIITMCGFMLFLVPGIIFAVWFTFASFILIAEDTKGMRALYKSREYVRGHWWAVLGRLVFMGLISLIVSWASGWVLRLTKIGWVEMVGTLLVSCVLLPLTLIYSFLTYKKLKNLKGDFVFVPDKRTRSGVRIVVIILITLLVLGVVANLFLTGLLLKHNSSSNNLQNSLSNNSQDSSSYQSDERDSDRISGLSSISQALVSYYGSHGTYPLVSGCNADNWDIIIDEFKDNFSPQVPIDPLNSENYMYSYGSDGKNFILRAYLENPERLKVLKLDLNGNILGCDCDGSAYCIGPKG